MGNRPAWWFRGMGGIGIVVSLCMVYAMERLQEASLSLWLHIPLTAIVLTLMAAGAAAMGVGLVEHQSREPD